MVSLASANFFTTSSGGPFQVFKGWPNQTIGLCHNATQRNALEYSSILDDLQLFLHASAFFLACGYCWRTLMRFAAERPSTGSQENFSGLQQTWTKRKKSLLTQQIIKILVTRVGFWRAFLNSFFWRVSGRNQSTATNIKLEHYVTLVSYPPIGCCLGMTWHVTPANILSETVY